MTLDSTPTDQATRVPVGTCESCGRQLKVKQHAIKRQMHLTCRCGTVTVLTADESQVQRAAKLRRTVPRKRREQKIKRKWIPDPQGPRHCIKCGKATPSEVGMEEWAMFVYGRPGSVSLSGCLPWSIVVLAVILTGGIGIVLILFIHFLSPILQALSVRIGGAACRPLHRCSVCKTTSDVPVVRNDSNREVPPPLATDLSDGEVNKDNLEPTSAGDVATRAAPEK